MFVTMLTAMTTKNDHPAYFYSLGSLRYGVNIYKCVQLINTHTSLNVSSLFSSFDSKGLTTVM